MKEHKIINIPLAIELLGPLNAIPNVPSLNIVVETPVKIKYVVEETEDNRNVMKDLIRIKFTEFKVLEHNIALNLSTTSLRLLAKLMISLKLYAYLRNLRSLIHIYAILSKHEDVNELNPTLTISSLIGGLHILQVNPIASHKLLPHHNPYIVTALIKGKEIDIKHLVKMYENPKMYKELRKLIHIIYLMFKESIIDYTYLKHKLGLKLNLTSDNYREVLFQVLGEAMKYNAKVLELYPNNLHDIFDKLNNVLYGTRISLILNGKPCIVGLAINKKQALEALNILRESGLESSWMSRIAVYTWTNDFYSLF